MKEAFITGANKGLGVGFVEVLVQQGYRVFAGVRRPKEFSFNDPNVIPIELDLGNSRSIDLAIKKITSQANQLSLIINNGAVQRNSPELGGAEKVCKLEQISKESLLKMFEINAVAPLMILKGLVPILKSEPSYCINISSARSVLYTDETPHQSANYGYRATKAALSSITMASTFDLPPSVRTFSVHPGLIKTDMNPKGNLCPQQGAALILSIADRWEPSMNGAFLRNDGTRWEL